MTRSTRAWRSTRSSSRASLSLDLTEKREDRKTRAGPRRPEIDDDGLLALQHLVLEWFAADGTYCHAGPLVEIVEDSSTPMPAVASAIHTNLDGGEASLTDRGISTRELSMLKRVRRAFALPICEHVPARDAKAGADACEECGSRFNLHVYSTCGPSGAATRSTGMRASTTTTAATPSYGRRPPSSAASSGATRTAATWASATAPRREVRRESRGRRAGSISVMSTKRRPGTHSLPPGASALPRRRPSRRGSPSGGGDPPPLPAAC